MSDSESVLASQAIATSQMAPLILGCCTHILLTGVILSMTTSFISTGRLKREPRYMKAVIGSVSILNLVQLGISVYDCVFWAANQNRTYDRFYEGTKADSLTPLLVGVMAFQVQGVYGWRAWQLLKGRWIRRIFATVVGLAMFASFFGSLFTTIINFGYAEATFDHVGLIDFDTMTSLWLWASFSVDCILSISMWILLRSKVAGFNQRLDSVLLRLSVLALQSGSYTAVAAFWGALSAEVFITELTVAISYPFLLVLPALYTISLFITLESKYAVQVVLVSGSGSTSKGTDMPRVPVSVQFGTGLSAMNSHVSVASRCNSNMV